MLTLIPNAQKTANQFRLRYRWTRFRLSPSFKLLFRIVLPILIIAFVLFRIWISGVVPNMVQSVSSAMHEKLASLPVFTIDEIVIENATTLQEAQIKAIIGIDLPVSALDVDRDRLSEDLLNIDEIGAASVRFDWLGAMHINLQPRVPAMIFYDGSKFQTVDIEGRRVEFLTARADRPELFVISGFGANRAVPEAEKILKLLKPIIADVRGLVRMGERRWDVVLTDNRRLQLPAAEPIDALYKILSQHQRNEILNREILSYDMRNPDRPVIRLKPVALDQRASERAKLAGLGV